jgi:hypothetical protein
MLTARPVLRSLRRVCPPRFFLSTKAPAPAAPVAAKVDEEDAISPVTERREEMTKFNKYMVYGKTGEYMPAPVLPDNVTELAALDPVDQGHRTHMDGTTRTVVIRQLRKKHRQAPLKQESIWKIFFNEDGISNERWNNSLMDWTSSADPYQCDPNLRFNNASEAVYFAKKRGWKFIVHAPIQRYMRRDGAQYQDNFFPQAIAAKVAAEGKSCAHWHRAASGASHYFRPLKFHGDGTVSQHGPNGDAEIAPAVEGCYKMR